MKSSIGQGQDFDGTDCTNKGLGHRNIVEEYRLKIMAKLGKKVGVGSSVTAETLHLNASNYGGSQPDFISQNLQTQNSPMSQSAFQREFLQSNCSPLREKLSPAQRTAS